MSYLGQCFARRGMNDMAASSCGTALKEKVGFDDEKKELIYALGSVLEKMGKTEEAMEQFKEIYQVDMGFKDVAAKIDKYYQAKGGQGLTFPSLNPHFAGKRCRIRAIASLEGAGCARFPALQFPVNPLTLAQLFISSVVQRLRNANYGNCFD